jgi:hypothetical protein
MAKGHATVSAHEVVAVCTTLAIAERFVKPNPHLASLRRRDVDVFYGPGHTGDEGATLSALTLNPQRIRPHR